MSTEPRRMLIAWTDPSHHAANRSCPDCAARGIDAKLVRRHAGDWCLYEHRTVRPIQRRRKLTSRDEYRTAAAKRAYNREYSRRWREQHRDRINAAKRAAWKTRREQQERDR